MKILLINPRRSKIKRRAMHGTVGSIDIPCITFPEVLAQLAANLCKTQSDNDVKLIDANALEYSYDFLADLMPAVDVLVFSTEPGYISNDCRLASVARELNPDVMVIMIETSVTGYWAKRFLDEFLAVDVIVHDAPALVVPEVIANGSDLSKVGGISYRTQGEVHTTAPSPASYDVNKQPFMAYDMIPVEKYSFPIIDAPLHEILIPGIRMRTTALLPSSQCVTMNPKRVVDEIEFGIAEWGFWGYFFLDEVFTYDEQRAREICNEIIERNLKLEWRCSTAFDKVDAQLCRLMYQAGCRQIDFTLSSDQGDAQHGRWSDVRSKTMVDAVRVARKAGIRVSLEIVLGAPEESYHSVRTLRRCAQKMNADNIVVHIACPFSSETFHDTVNQNKLWTDDDIYRRMVDTDVRIGTDVLTRSRYMSAEELEAMCKKLQEALIKRYMIQKIIREPHTFFSVLRASRNPGEFFNAVKAGVCFFIKTLFRG